jgi:hypothetical protein
VVGRIDAVGAYRLRFKDAAAARKARAAVEGDEDVGANEMNLTIAPPAVWSRSR